MRTLYTFVFINFCVFVCAANAQWVQIDGSLGGSVRCFVVSDTNLFAGTSDGVFLSTDEGTSWRSVNEGLPKIPWSHSRYYVEVIAVSGTNLFAGSYGVFMSTDQGTSWTSISNGFPKIPWDTSLYCQITALAVIDTILFAGTSENGIFRSTDNGANWTAVKTDLLYVGTLIASGENLFACIFSDYGGIWRSTDMGLTWTKVSNTTMYQVSCVLPISNGYLFAGCSNGVFRSTDNGDHWTPANNGLPQRPVQQIAASGNNLFAGCWDGGVFLSTHNGTSWIEMNDGLLNQNVMALAVVGTFLIIGNDVGGIAKLCFSTMNDISAISPFDPPDGTVHILLDNIEQFSRSVQLKWKSANCNIITSNINLQVSIDSNFVTRVIDTTLVTSSIKEICPVRFSRLASGTTYYWRLSLVYPDGSNSPWTGTMKFTTAGGEIAGVLFDDFDGDGIRDDDEPGINGWKLLLSGKDTGDVRTDSDGRYTFAGLDSGNYAVTTSSAGVRPQWSMWTLTYPDTNLYSLAVGFDSATQGINFGWNFPWNSIGGRVFEDLNENGIFDSVMEQTLPGWLLVLSGYESNQVTTDEKGEYCFRRLWDNYYEVKLGPIPAGWESVPSGFEAVCDFYFNFGNHPDGANFAVHRIPSRVKIGLTVTENLYEMESVKIRFGVRTGATYGIWTADSACTYTDYAEGEYELPPLSGGPLDARFVDSAVPSTGRFGLGSYTDMRPYYSEAQADTYKFRFVPAVGYPITIRWSRAAIESSYSGTVILKDPFMQETNMKQTDSLVIVDPEITLLRLIATGPKMPVVGAVDTPNIVLPTKYQLAQNYPNPFNPTTTISYQLPTQSYVTLKIFDMLGREVATLVNRVEEPGYKSIMFDGKGLPSGVYYYRLQAGNYVATKKLLLLR